MKTASAVLQDLSLFVTLTFQIEEQKKKKKTAAILLAKTNKSAIISFASCFLKQVFWRQVCLWANSMVSTPFTQVFKISCQLRGIPISPRTSWITTFEQSYRGSILEQPLCQWFRKALAGTRVLTGRSRPGWTLCMILVLYLIDSQTSENMPSYFYICFTHSRKLFSW